MMNYRAVRQKRFTVILNGQGADEAMGGYIGAGWFKVGAVDVQAAEPKILFDNILPDYRYKAL
jgi:asparagine synthetase B (glutamine-hydrolysing)